MVKHRVAIIQARMSSTRLPGKSMMDICGRPMAEHVIRRACQAKLIDNVVLAVPVEAGCGDLHEVAARQNVWYFSYYGPKDDLVGRYQQAAEHFSASDIIRIPADNPCVDPDEIDRIILKYEQEAKPIGQWLYTNLDRDVCGNGYPGGLGAEVYNAWFMQWLYANVPNDEEREHPHKWAFNNDRVRTVDAPPHLQAPHLRFDVNTQEDLAYVRKIYDKLGEGFRAKELIEFAR